jgi:acetyl esterase/lipase
VNLDPEIAAFLDALPDDAFDFGSWALADIPANRDARAAAALVPALPPTTTVHRDRVDPVGLRVYTPPEKGSDRPCLLWIHGGGYFMGSALVTDPRLQRWVEDLGCVIVAVDYRLAPEHPYPAALEDCATALAWTFDTAGKLGVDADRVVVGGASAGGGLAAALAQLERDRGTRAIVAQMLVYPMLDDREHAWSHSTDRIPVWDRAATRLGWRAYLGDRGGDVPPYAVPARAEDLAGLPPAYIAVGAVDLFRNECVDYASRLLDAGVPTELHVYPGAPHGFDVLTRSAVADRANRDLLDALHRAFTRRSPVSVPSVR